MLVVEIALDPTVINASPAKSSWIVRAACSLAEAMRLQTSDLLDIEITELNAGYRLLKGGQMTYADIYLYDSLSSGAGYSTEIAKQIEELLNNVELSLKKCKCKNACHECIKHYRNRSNHALLDRLAALELLEWAKTGKTAWVISIKKQQEIIKPLIGILGDYEIEVDFPADKTTINVSPKGSHDNLELKVYPSMLVEPTGKDIIYVSDFEAKYSRAYSVDRYRAPVAGQNASPK